MLTPKSPLQRHRATVENGDGGNHNCVGISYNYGIRFFDTIPKAKMECHHHFFIEVFIISAWENVETKKCANLHELMPHPSLGKFDSFGL
jgi:hypothetical protein